MQDTQHGSATAPHVATPDGQRVIGLTMIAEAPSAATRNAAAGMKR